MNELTVFGLLVLVGLLLVALRAARLARGNSGGGYADLLTGWQWAAPPTRRPAGGLVTGAGLAPADPPSLAETLTRLPPLSVPVGWQRSNGTDSLVFAGLTEDTNHILITGQSGSGKDNLATSMLLSLAVLNPDEVALCIIDGKGLDYARWENKAVVWRLASDPADLAPTLEALTAERQRRGRLLRSAGVSRWEDYPDHRRLPLLAVYISELTLLVDVLGSVGKLEGWLNPELAAGRAFGLRYIIGSQTVANFSTRWRSQVSLFIAGYQPTASQDEPNTGLPTSAIRAAYGIPPSELPAGIAGVFTAVQGRSAETVRASYVSPADLTQTLAILPDRPQPARQSVTLEDLLTGRGGAASRSVSVPVYGAAPAELGQSVGNTDTNTPPTRQQQQQRAKIRKALAAGLSVTDIAEIIGGNRNSAFALVKAVKLELEAEAAAETVAE